MDLIRDFVVVFVACFVALVSFGIITIETAKRVFSQQIKEILNPPMLILPDNIVDLPQSPGTIYDSQGPVFTTPPPDPAEPDISPDPDDIPDTEENELNTIAAQGDDPDNWPIVGDLWVVSRLSDKQFQLLRRIGTILPVEGPDDMFHPPSFRIHPQVMEKYDTLHRQRHTYEGQDD